MPADPSLLYVEHTLPDGSIANLALVRTHWRSEGSCIVEIVDAERKAARVVVNGIWRARDQQGARCLEVEIDDPGVDSWGELMDALMSAAVADCSWNFDSFTPIGGF